MRCLLFSFIHCRKSNVTGKSHSFSLDIRLFLLQRIAEIGGKHNKIYEQKEKE